MLVVAVMPTAGLDIQAFQYQTDTRHNGGNDDGDDDYSGDDDDDDDDGVRNKNLRVGIVCLDNIG